MNWLKKHWLYLTHSPSPSLLLESPHFPASCSPSWTSCQSCPFHLPNLTPPPDLLKSSQELCFKTRVLKKQTDLWKPFPSLLCVNQQPEPSDILFVRRRQYECLIISSFGSGQSHSLVTLKA